MALYLRFTESTEGILYSQWSKDAEIEEDGKTLAKIVPEKEQPAFKFKQNHGRTEIVRRINGPRKKPAFYQGWSHFIKLAKPINGTFSLLDSDYRVKVVFNENGNIVHCAVGDEFMVNEYSAVACVHEDTEAFDSVKTLSVGNFVSIAGRHGYGLNI